MKKFVFITLLWVSVIWSFNGFSQQSISTGSAEIIILHTNDMHSKIDNMAKLAYLSDSLRKLHPYVFLVAAGDDFTGNPIVDMLEDKGNPMINLMNLCGFNATAIGNHEFDMGQELLNKRMDQARFPFISCNIKVEDAILKQPKPYVLLNAGKDITIALLGATELNDKGIPDTHPSKLTGLTFEKPVAKMKAFAWLKEKYGILIGLTHLGVETDVLLADSMPQLDLIIGGHSHTLIEKPMIRNSVLIVQAGANLKYVGKTTLVVEKGKVKERRDEIIPMKALTRSNPGIQTMIDQYNQNEAFSKMMGIAEESLEGYDQLGSLMTDALTSRLHVDFAFQNMGGIRVYSIPKGNITLKDIYQLDPFNNQVVVFRMNAAEIRSLICNAFNIEKEIDLQVSGMTYTVTIDTNGRCIKVEMADMKGHALDPGRDYTVAMNSYMSESYRFDHHDPGTATSVTTAQAVIDYLNEVKKVNYKGVKRVKVTH